MSADDVKSAVERKFSSIMKAVGYLERHLEHAASDGVRAIIPPNLAGEFSRALSQLTEENERLRTGDALANALMMTGCRDEADLIDMANVGRSTMDRMAEVVTNGPLKGWSPADDPAEIITDLANKLDDALHDYGNAESEAKGAEQDVADLKERATKAEAERDEANEARAILQQAVLERTRERDEAQKDADVLDWLAENANLDLSYGYDDEWEEMSWRVHRVSGNVNDREWTLLSTGKTPLAALNDARALLARSAQGGSDA